MSYYYKNIDISEDLTFEVIPRSLKSQILNNLKSYFDEFFRIEILKEEPDTVILGMIKSNLDVIEDAMIIDMFRFQFAALNNILTVEKENIKDLMGISEEELND